MSKFEKGLFGLAVLLWLAIVAAALYVEFAGAPS